MNQPQTHDNEVEVSSKQTMLTAQSDSVELYHALCDRLIELNEKTNEVARLREELERAKEMVMDVARRGDEMAAHWKERAERAEALIKQLHHLAKLLPEASKA